jgi:hypothetical protein
MSAEIALLGMPSNFAVSGDCTRLMPPSALMSLNPSVPLLPVPESTMAIARSRWSAASDENSTSTGWRWPRGSVGLDTCSPPSPDLQIGIGSDHIDVVSR